MKTKKQVSQHLSILHNKNSSLSYFIIIITQKISQEKMKIFNFLLHLNL